VKCPKCEYLGFETGDRCKNCGYDFSLITAAPSPLPDLSIAPPTQQTPDTQFWLDQLDEALGKPVLAPPLELPAITSPGPVQMRADSALPLFLPPVDADDDQPLIKLPVAPRAPLSVRKTPEIPRLRAVPKPAPRPKEPVLLFADETTPVPDLTLREEVTAAPARAAVAVTREPGGAAARLGAVALDYLILLTIDAAVLYLTLRMTALPMADWRVLPLAPLVAFLVLVKFAYFAAFTAVGGQTIGKMALGLRVVLSRR
jgi:hypothetical protein